MLAIIVANGHIADYANLLKWIETGDFVIAVDGGMRHLVAVDFKPDVWIGDMDSWINDSTHEAPWLETVEQVKYESEKDMSDTELALEWAHRKKCTELVLMGMLGGRVDHELINMSHLIPLTKRGVHAWIEDGHQRVFYVTDHIQLSDYKNWLLSIVPLSPLGGVTIEGCYYPLNRATIDIGSSLGLSNRVIENDAKVKMTSGEAFIILTKQM
jgi:thiamine pyrophosphokinase